MTYTVIQEMPAYYKKILANANMQRAITFFVIKPLGIYIYAGEGAMRLPILKTTLHACCVNLKGDFFSLKNPNFRCADVIVNVVKTCKENNRFEIPSCTNGSNLVQFEPTLRYLENKVSVLRRIYFETFKFSQSPVEGTKIISKSLIFEKDIIEEFQKLIKSFRESNNGSTHFTNGGY